MTVGGLRILGLGGSMRYNRGINQYTEREMRQRVNRLRFKLWLSGGIDILLTIPPRAIWATTPIWRISGLKPFWM